MDNKAVFRRSTHPLHHTWKLVCLCHHMWGFCSSQRGQDSPKALQRPCVLPKLVAAGHAWSSAAGVFMGGGRKRKKHLFFLQLQGSTLVGRAFEAHLERSRMARGGCSWS